MASIMGVIPEHPFHEHQALAMIHGLEPVAQPFAAYEELTPKMYSRRYSAKLSQVTSPRQMPVRRSSLLGKSSVRSRVHQTLRELRARGMGDNDDENLELTRLFMEFEIDKLRKENEIKLKSLQATPVSKETAMEKFLNAAKAHGIAVKKA